MFKINGALETKALAKTFGKFCCLNSVAISVLDGIFLTRFIGGGEDCISA